MSHELEEHIKNWFDYQWNSRMTLHEESVLDELPEKLKAEIAMNVHLNTLKRVAIFQVMSAAMMASIVFCSTFNDNLNMHELWNGGLVSSYDISNVKTQKQPV